MVFRGIVNRTAQLIPHLGGILVGYTALWLVARVYRALRDHDGPWPRRYETPRHRGRLARPILPRAGGVLQCTTGARCCRHLATLGAPDIVSVDAAVGAVFERQFLCVLVFEDQRLGAILIASLAHDVSKGRALAPLLADWLEREKKAQRRGSDASARGG